MRMIVVELSASTPSAGRGNGGRAAMVPLPHGQARCGRGVGWPGGCCGAGRVTAAAVAPVGNHEDGVSGWAGLVAGGGGVLALVCGGALAANQAGWQNGQP